MFSARSPVRLTVPVKDPFDWHLTMTYPSRAYAHPIYRAEGDRLHRVVWLGRRPWRLTLGPARRHGKDWRLAVEGYPLRGEAPGAGAGAGNDGAAGGGADADSGAVAQALQDAVAQIVSADHDLAAMADAVAGDPVMARLVQRFQGLRILRMPSVFEGLADAIVGQQISVPAAHKIRLRLMTEFFPRAAAEPDFLPDPLPFPHPAAVAGADLDDLIRCGLIGRRAEYLAGVARLAVDGELPGDDLKNASLHAAVKRLTAIRGVGPWTAELTLLFSVGRTDICPAGDLGLQDAVARAYGLDRRPAEQEVREMAAAWAGWESYAAYYLWGTRRWNG
ncbi:MAG TPA: hypothetical protein VK008_01535 [Sphingobacteriaceae bacterium]|nr:hypothetical protein [Sphingobacteriaceae bacterium]